MAFRSEKLKELDSTITGEVRKNAELAVSEPKHDPATITHHMTATPYNLQVTSFREREVNTPVEDKSTEPIPMRDLITRALIEEMKKDERIVIFGQDVADFPVVDPAGKLRARVACSTSHVAWVRLTPTEYGTPRSRRPRYSVQRWAIRWRASCPLSKSSSATTSTPAGSSLWTRSQPSGGAPTARSPARWLSASHMATSWEVRARSGTVKPAVGPIAHYPGLRVVVPSLGSDAVGLLREAILSGDPVVFLEPKSLYEAKVSRSYYPGPDYRVPLGWPAWRAKAAT